MEDDLQLSYENVNTLKSGKFQSELRYPKSMQRLCFTEPNLTQISLYVQILINYRVYTLCLIQLVSAETLPVFPIMCHEKNNRAYI